VWALRGANECLDKQKRNCKHPEYDPTTLFIPPN
jgi:DNA mismatch repair protein MSH6